jgi:hypothetical protein
MSYNVNPIKKPVGGIELHSLEMLPEYEKSKSVLGMSFTGKESVIGTGDMWPMTWGDDGAIYAAAGDNSGFLDHFQTMNFWRIDGFPPSHEVALVNDLGFLKGEGWDPEVSNVPIKPAGLVSVDCVLYLAVEDMRYTLGRFGNQINLQSWIIHSKDHGKTWQGMPDPGTSERKFLTGVFASPHFLQFGRDYSGAPDDWVYAYSSAGDDGIAAWSAGDHTYLARVPRSRILDRSSWEFYTGASAALPSWSKRLGEARPVFSYPRKTGENEVVYHPGLKKYLLLNWAFIDCTNHTLGSLHSELSIFEAEKPWGPWSTVCVRRDWGSNCDYQPRLPTKWIDLEGERAWLVSAGNFHQKGGRLHYGFVTAPVKFGDGDFGDLDASSSEIPGELEDFIAEALSDSEIKLSWVPERLAAFYRICRDGTKFKDIAALYPARYIDEGLAPLESHEYKVQAMSAAGDTLALSPAQSCASLPPMDPRSFGLNLCAKGFFDGKRVWLGEGALNRFDFNDTWNAYRDERIKTVKLSPDPGPLEPALRSMRGEVPGIHIAFKRLSGKRALVSVYALDTGLCGSPAAFEIWIQDSLVDRFENGGGDKGNWRVMGPYETDISADGRLVVEGRKFSGVGGIAAIALEISD